MILAYTCTLLYCHSLTKVLIEPETEHEREMEHVEHNVSLNPGSVRRATQLYDPWERRSARLAPRLFSLSPL